MKKILVFNGYYIPAKNYGGPTASLATIVDNCGDDFDFYIIAANHDLNDKKVFDNIHEGWNQVGKAKVLYINLDEINYKIRPIKELISSLNPDVVWLMGILVPADKWFVAKVCRSLKIPYLISPRGEVNENAFRMKIVKKKIVVGIANLFNVYKDAWFHATSQEEICGLKKHFGVADERIILAPNISSNLKPENRIIKKSRGRINIVYLSRIHRIKNLLIAIRAIKMLNGVAVFDIYGPLEDTDYWKECEEEIKKCPPNIKINYCGVIEREHVAQTLSKYHCMILPTSSENYGHVIAESLSVTCPVIISKGTTPWDDIDTAAGFTCELNNVDQFVSALKTIEYMDEEEYHTLIKSTSEYYVKRVNSDNAVQRHIQMLNRVSS